MKMSVACLIAAGTLVVSPAIAEPTVQASMPVIRADIAGSEIAIRLERAIFGPTRRMEPRTIVLVGRDASGAVIGEATTTVARRLTYAKIAMPPAFEAARTVTVLVR